MLGLLFASLALIPTSESALTGCFCIFGIAIILTSGFGLVSTAVSYSAAEIAVTNRRVIGKTGFIRRQALELRLDKIESARVNQPLMGRLLGYGTVVLIGSGGTRTRFKNIADPMQLHRQIQNQII